MVMGRAADGIEYVRLLAVTSCFGFKSNMTLIMVVDKPQLSYNLLKVIKYR